MNSAAKPSKGLAFVPAGLLVVCGLLAAGCGDYGPTNMYSKTLFGQNQSGASMQFWCQEYTLSATAGTPDGVGPDQYVVNMKNVGSGGVIGPITMVVTAAGSDDGLLEAYTASPGAPSPGLASQTVTFGYANQAIYPGDTLVGNASNPAMGGRYQYSFQVGFPSADSGTAETFNYTATDSKGDNWTGTFSGTNE